LFSDYINLDGCCAFIANETAKIFLNEEKQKSCTNSFNIDRGIRNIEIYGNCNSTIEIVKFYKKEIDNLIINNGQLNSLNDLNSLSVFPHTNLSHNSFTKVFIERKTILSSVLVLDLSYNQITSVVIESFESFPVLKNLYLNSNRILTYNVDQKMSFTYLELSNNPLNFFRKSSNEIFNDNLKYLSLNYVESFKYLSHDMIIRSTTPFYLENLSLQNNEFKKFPSCHGIFKETNLISLDLSFNKIRSVGITSFVCLKNLKHLILSNNEIVHFTSDLLNWFPLLIILDLSENYLQHIPVKLLESFLTKRKNLPTKQQLDLSGNLFECDCTMVELHNYLSSVNNTFTTFTCLNNVSVAVLLTSVPLEELVCYPPELKYVNSSKAHENNPGEISCVFVGKPKPKVKWITPNNKTTISMESVENLDDFYLSPFGNTLYVKKLKLKLTGKYKCIGYNKVDQSNSTIVTIAMIPSSFSAFIVVGGATISFIVALIINFTNLSLYLIDHIKKQKNKRKYRENQLLDELDCYGNDKYDEAIDNIPKIVRKSAISLDDLSKHEYSTQTCHDYLLDTMAKGAHTVKKTIIDARNYQFHFNVVAYASSLRDRMYNIEIPSTSFQLPNLPTMDIEKLSTTVREKSHNIASSVGSVLTFKRFLKEQSSTESEGKSSLEQIKSSSNKKDMIKNKTKADCDNIQVNLRDVVDDEINQKTLLKNVYELN